MNAKPNATPSALTRRRFLAGSAAASAGLLLAPARRLLAVPEGLALEKTDLFEADTGGYAIYRIPGIVATPGGALLAYCEARKDYRGDWGDIDVLVRRSTDGGRTWTSPDVLVDVRGVAKNPAAVAQNLGDEDAITVNNPVAIADRETGAVHFLYCVEYGRCFYMRSDDDGATFSEPTEITGAFEAFRPEYDWKVIATGPGHGIQLENGRLLVPIWMSLGTGGHAHRPSVVSTIYSDDHGATWQRGELALVDGLTYTYPDQPGAQAVVNPSETVAVQLADGRVMLNARTESPEHRRAITTSPDGAAAWSAPAFDEQLYEAICMGSIVRLTEEPQHDRNRIVFANPDSRPVAAEYGVRARRNLSVKLSYDEGETWPVNKVLDAGISAYSDLAVGPDKAIYCFYERGGLGEDHYRTQYLTLARFDLAWLTDGEDQLG